jgi:Spy/CpxP family protein refolding chaperone
MREDHKEFMEWKLRKELNLSDEQVAKVAQLHEKQLVERQKMQEDRRKAMESNREAMKATMEAHKAEMKKILTPEQYKKWEELRFERMEEAMEYRRSGGMHNMEGMHRGEGMYNGEKMHPKRGKQRRHH